MANVLSQDEILDMFLKPAEYLVEHEHNLEDSLIAGVAVAAFVIHHVRQGCQIAGTNHTIESIVNEFMVRTMNLVASYEEDFNTPKGLVN